MQVYSSSWDSIYQLVYAFVGSLHMNYCMLHVAPCPVKCI